VFYVYLGQKGTILRSVVLPTSPMNMVIDGPRRMTQTLHWIATGSVVPALMVDTQD
jgi:hypothetical protein